MPGRSLNARRGATLIEAITGVAVFAFMILASIALARIGTSGWRVVESKTDINRCLSRFENDIIQEVKRASLSSVGVYTPTDDYRWALWFKTPMNDPLKVNPTTGVPTGLGDSLLPILNAGAPVMQRYILYYVTRLNVDAHKAQYGFACASYNSNAGPDTTCPHKLLVKKELYLLDGQTTGVDTIGAQGDPAAITRLRALMEASPTLSEVYGSQESLGHPSRVHRAQVFSDSILSFEVTRLAPGSGAGAVPTVSATGPIILFDVKAFKTTTSANVIEVGMGAATAISTTSDGLVNVKSTVLPSGDVDVHTDSNIDARYAPFTVQVDNRVIPQNP